MFSAQKINPVMILSLSALSLLVVISRFLPHPPNFTPVIALFVFFAGVGSPLLLSLVISFAFIVGSDAIIGFYDGIEYVYLSYLSSFLVGRLFSVKKSNNYWSHAIQSSIFGGVFGSVLFFAISNFGVWKTTTMYASTWEGLITCYIMALPFFQATVLSTVGSVALFYVVNAVIVTRVVPATK
jgi:hypothetical protein